LIDQVSLRNFDIDNGPSKTFATNMRAGYSLTNWTVNGDPVPPQGR